MTESERNRRGEKSAAIVARLVRAQLRAMGCERFDLGIKRGVGEMILREGQALVEIENAIKWLRHENAKGAHIYVRPAGDHSLTLLDDLSAEDIERMKLDGFAPAAIIETSPNNFQAWLNRGEILDAAISTRAAKQLAGRFNGDPSSADWRHFGRLAGFTNPKPERQLPSGMRHSRASDPRPGASIRMPANFSLPSERPAMASPGRFTNPQKDGLVTAGELVSGHSNSFLPIRCMAAIFTAPTWRGPNTLPLGEIKNELLNGRDLAKKGSRKRQLEYVERTARKAIEQMD
jgi:hypothetical protein